MLRTLVFLFGLSTVVLFFALMVAISALLEAVQNCGGGRATA